MTTLLEVPGNPAPTGAVVERIEAADGVGLRVARWPAREMPSRGTVFVFQGRAEFIEKYFETIGELLGRGYAVVALDWRGQGLSDRLAADPRLGHVRHFADYFLDIDALVRSIARPACPPPWFALAHSMGGAISIAAAHAGRLPAERLVCSAPMIGIHRVPRGGQLLAEALTLLGRGAQYIPGGGATSIMTKPFAGNPLTRDEGRYARNGRIAADHPRLAIGDPSVRWVREALRLTARFEAQRHAIEVPTPLLLVAAGADTVVSTAAIEGYGARSRTGPALVIAGARHELLQETDAVRAEFWAAFDAFIPGSQARVAQGGLAPLVLRNG